MGNERTQTGNARTRVGNSETLIGTKGKLIGDKGTRIGNKGTPNRRQTNIIKNGYGVVTQKINFNRNFVVDESDIPYFVTISKLKVWEYCKQTILSRCFVWTHQQK